MALSESGKASVGLLDVRSTGGGDLALAYVQHTSGVDISSATTTELIATPPGYLFIIYSMMLRNDSASIATLTLKSNGVAMPPNIVMLANSVEHLGGSGLPIFVGKGSGEDFDVTNTGTAPVVGIGIAWALRPIAV